MEIVKHRKRGIWGEAALIPVGAALTDEAHSYTMRSRCRCYGSYRLEPLDRPIHSKSDGFLVFGNEDPCAIGYEVPHVLPYRLMPYFMFTETILCAILSTTTV